MTEQSYKPEYSHSWALLVGIDDYERGRLPPLSTAVKGVRALADLLRSEFGFDPARILTLENEQATRRAILRAFTDPLSRPDKVGPDARVLIYFAGHGVTFDFETPQGKVEVGCIVPYDAEPGYIDTTIPMDDMTRLAERMYAKHVLFLLDACFSGFATTREVAPGVERQLEDFLTRPARQAIAAGTRDQAVADMWGPGGHSLFTGFLLDGLSGASPAPGGVLRAFHLAGYLQDQVAQHSHSLQTPQYAPLMGSRGGDFIFSVREVIELPAWLLAATTSDDPTQRLVAVGQLRALARAEGPDKAAQALAKLEGMAASDTDLMVRRSAHAALEELVPQTSVTSVVRAEPIVLEPQPGSAVEESVAIEPQPELADKEDRAGLPAWAIGTLVVGALLVIGLVLRGLFALPAATTTPAPEVTEGPAEEPPEEQPVVAPTEKPVEGPSEESIEEPIKEPTGHIVFTCFIDDIDEVCIMNTDGSEQQQLTHDPATDWYASLSPDGRTIAFSSRRDNVFEIYLMDTAGENLRRLTQDLGSNFAPTFSPDGSLIVFASTSGSYPHQNVWVIGADGSEPTQLTRDAGDNLDPVWSPDGAQIAFASSRTGQMELYVMNADGSNVRQLTFDIGVGGRSDWSPDGRHLAFYAGPEDDRDIFIMDAGGTDIRQLTDGGDNKAPSFSPDGEWIAYASYIDGDDEIFIMRIDGSAVRQLTFNDRPDWQPRWGP